uniref:Variable lymphocyte receptor A n=1 Tax=Mordacia mordax TaxID=7755 RepID=A0A8K1T074_MORMR|nr:variable lymphocyte receptor A [Mordacia mordax]
MRRLTSSLPSLFLFLLVVALVTPRPGSASWKTCRETGCACNETKREVNCQSKSFESVPSGIPADTEDPDGVTCSSGESVNKITNDTLGGKCPLVENKAGNNGDEDGADLESNNWSALNVSEPAEVWSLPEISCGVEFFGPLSLCVAHLLLAVTVISLISSLVKILPSLL